MRVLSRTVTVRQLALVSVVALSVGVGGTAVAGSLSAKQEASAPRANLGSVGGLNYRTGTANVGNGTQGNAIAHCPNSKNVTGGGVLMPGFYNTGQVNSSQPYDDGDSDSTPDDGWRAYVDVFGGSSQLITVYAICK